MSSLDELFEGGSEDDRPMSFEVAGDGPTPFDYFANLEDRERIAGALMKLDTLYREVLVLRFHEDLSLEEISKVTRSPLSTVKSRLYRGLAAIKPKLSSAATCGGASRACGAISSVGPTAPALSRTE
jgi:RNA polymerase sigma-70 factor (ECF subfamily)